MWVRRTDGETVEVDARTGHRLIFDGHARPADAPKKDGDKSKHRES